MTNPDTPEMREIDKNLPEVIYMQDDEDGSFERSCREFGTPYYRGDKIESLRSQVERYREATELLEANSYDHHTPHMICVPKDKWKEAMKLSEGREE